MGSVHNRPGSLRPYKPEWGCHLRKLLLVLLVIWFLWPQAASAQLAVADAPVLVAIGQVVLELKTMMDQTLKQAEELANWGAVIQQIQAIAQLTTDLEALIQEIDTLDEGWGELYTSGTALCSIDEAVSWKGQALQWQNQGFALARKARRLLGRGLAVLGDMQMVLNGIVGSTSGAQSTSALLAVIASQIQQLQGLTATFQSADLGKDVIESVIGIHLVCIQNASFNNWGSYSR